MSEFLVHEVPGEPGHFSLNSVPTSNLYKPINSITTKYYLILQMRKLKQKGDQGFTQTARMRTHFLTQRPALFLNTKIMDSNRMH